MFKRKTIRAQLPVTLKTAVPIMIGQMGQMAMILIDTFMVGQLGPSAIASVGLGGAMFYVFFLFGAGTLFALDYLVSFARGKDDLKECHHWLWQGVYLSFTISIPILIAIEFVAPGFITSHYPSEIATDTVQFLRMLTLSLPSFLLYIAFRQYLQAMGSVRPATVIVLAAVLANIFFNWIFIFGHLGAPALGVMGAGLATTITRTLMALGLISYTFYRDAKLRLGLRQSPRGVNLKSQRRLWRLGLPGGVQFTFETGVFSLSTSLVSGLGVVPAAAHAIVLNLASFTYMIAVGMAGAAAILVGHATGRGDRNGATVAGWTAIACIVVIMGLNGVGFALFGPHIAALFTQDGEVIRLCGRLLLLVALFQVADGLQSVGGGALRGLGETRSTMIANLLGHWGIGLPVALFLCFSLAWGVLGIWLGLTAGLFVVALIVILRWEHRTGS
ncbi:MAG: MATE family efflux transporter [Deltaproteobacteria bacterium]|nr:MATE family efflux transporter [Deltaproteobacteria bacterium]MBI3295571.1 MATE family efflux transporter [Deltaproteobacteria bacterium]